MRAQLNPRAAAPVAGVAGSRALPIIRTDIAVAVAVVIFRTT